MSIGKYISNCKRLSENDPMPASFGARLKTLREAKGLTGYRVAKDAGISQPHYHHLESGKRQPTPDAIEKLAPVLGIPVDQMLAWADADRLGAEGIERINRYVLGVNQRIETDVELLDSLRTERRQLMQGPASKAVEARINELDSAIAAQKKALLANASSLKLARAAIEGEQRSIEALEGGLDISEDLKELSDAWEEDVLRKTGAISSPDYSSESDFWYLPRADRRRHLQNLLEVWEEGENLRKKAAEQRAGKRA